MSDEHAIAVEPVSEPERISAIVDLQTGEFVPEGHEQDDRFVCVQLPRNPDPLRECYSGKADDPIKDKTPEKLAAALETQLRLSIDPAIRAVLILGLMGQLKRAPTDEELAAELATFTKIRKGLA